MVIASVHPHARGEYAVQLDAQVDAGRSPPRTWGIQPGATLPSCQRPFTPTHVGNTSPLPSALAMAAVHPHARGEYAEGQVEQSGRHPFTPTHVGNTSP